MDDTVRLCQQWTTVGTSLSALWRRVPHSALVVILVVGIVIQVTAMLLTLVVLPLLTRRSNPYFPLCSRLQQSSVIALMVWTSIQPILYQEWSNAQFVTESITLLGGLFLLQAAQAINTTTTTKPSSSSSPGSLSHRTIRHYRHRVALLSLMGRWLLPTMYLYYAYQALQSLSIWQETDTVWAYSYIVSLNILQAVVCCGAVIVTGISLVLGLGSRKMAVLLGTVQLIATCRQHAIWNYVRYVHHGNNDDDDGVWIYRNMPVPSASYWDDSTTVTWNDVADHVFDLHRYYFFLGLSTTAAVWLLALHGPGRVAVEAQEDVLPVRVWRPE